MNTITKKQAIMQSLDAMNTTEMERVLDYIKGILYNEANDSNYLRFKRKAMSEIKQALQSGEKVDVAV